MNSRVWNSIAARVRILEREERGRRRRRKIDALKPVITSDAFINDERSNTKLQICNEFRKVEEKALNNDVNHKDEKLVLVDTNQDLEVLMRPLSEEIQRVDCNLQEMVQSWKQMVQLVMGTNTTVQNLAQTSDEKMNLLTQDFQTKTKRVAQTSDEKMNAFKQDFQTQIKRLEQAFDIAQQHNDERLDEVGCNYAQLDARMREAIQNLKDAHVNVAGKLQSKCQQLVSDMEMRLRHCFDQNNGTQKSGKENRRNHGKTVDDVPRQGVLSLQDEMSEAHTQAVTDICLEIWKDRTKSLLPMIEKKVERMIAPISFELSRLREILYNG